MDAVSLPSAALLEAQARLLQLRAEVQARRQEAGLPVGQFHQADELPWDTDTSPSKLATIADSVVTLPGHLGWGGDRLTAVLRQAPETPRQNSSTG